MTKPVAEWDEDYLLGLPLENDTLERKGSTLLDLSLPQANEGKVLNELAKQLSAFANTGGGRVIYGLTDKGEVDHGGVSRILRGRRSTKEWLEDLIPSLTDYEIVGVNVYEITGKEADSKIHSSRAIYVVDIPDSDRAPHQSKKDYKYYVRLGAKSEPASHRLIEDIRNRAKHPIVSVIRGEIVSLAIPRESLPKIFGLLGVTDQPCAGKSRSDQGGKHVCSAEWPARPKGHRARAHRCCSCASWTGRKEFLRRATAPHLPGNGNCPLLQSAPSHRVVKNQSPIPLELVRARFRGRGGGSHHIMEDIRR